jgi:hypothetical protein
VNRSAAISIDASMLRVVRAEGPGPAGRARIWAALAMTLSLPTAACAPSVARPPRASLDPCESAPPGHACEISVEEGPAPVLSRCKKQLDGTLVCDSPEPASRDGRENLQ